MGEEMNERLRRIERRFRVDIQADTNAQHGPRRNMP
jgi:hypothetical protein